MTKRQTTYLTYPVQDSSVSNLIFMPDTDMKETTAWDVLLFLSQRVEEVDVSDASFACQVCKFWLWHPDDWDTVFKCFCLVFRPLLVTSKHACTCFLGVFFSLVCAHMCFVAREAAMWELEERHLQEKHQLLKQQLKDQYFMQRHQLLKRHEKVQAQSGIVNVTVKFK